MKCRRCDAGQALRTERLNCSTCHGFGHVDKWNSPAAEEYGAPGRVRCRDCQGSGVQERQILERCGACGGRGIVDGSQGTGSEPELDIHRSTVDAKAMAQGVLVIGLLVAAGSAVLFLQDYLETRDRKLAQAVLESKRTAALKALGAGFMSGTSVCNGQRVRMDVNVVFDLVMDAGGNMGPATPRKLAYAVYYTEVMPGNRRQSRAIYGQSLPLANDGSFSFSGFNLRGANGTMSGRFAKDPRLHVLRVPGCQRVQWN